MGYRALQSYKIYWVLGITLLTRQVLKPSWPTVIAYYYNPFVELFHRLWVALTFRQNRKRIGMNG